MRKIEFKCKKCGKTIDVQQDIYDKIYKDKEYCLSCRQTEKQEDEHRKPMN